MKRPRLPARSWRRRITSSHGAMPAGPLANSEYAKVAVRFDARGAASLLAGAGKVETFSSKNLEVRFITDHKMDDGRFANNGWLQECPDPITRITWDNAIYISPRLAKEIGFNPVGALLQVARAESADFENGKESAPVAELTVGGRKIRGPVHIQPGLSNYTLVIALGYGRTVTGHVGQGAGFSAYALRTSAAMHIAAG